RERRAASGARGARPRSATPRSGCRGGARPGRSVRSRPSCGAPPASSARVFPHPAVLNPPVHEGVAAMMSDADRRKAADILVAAEKDRKQAVQLSKTWPGITMADAYAISPEVANRKIAAGAKLIGHKVGLTSKAMQRSSQIDEPDYGHLLDN